MNDQAKQKKQIMMKGKFTFLKMSLVGLFLVTAMGVSGQEVTPETPSVQIICDGSSATLQATPGYDTYIWFFENDGGAPQPLTGRTSDTLEVDATGNYYVQVGNDEDGCLSDVSEAFPVYEAPALAVSIAAVDGDLNYCVNETDPSVTLNATVTPSSVPAGLTIQYQWYKADDATGTNEQEISGENSSSYTVTETLTDPFTQEKFYYFVKVSYAEAATCVESSNVLEITVDPQPATPTITIATP